MKEKSYFRNTTPINHTLNLRPLLCTLALFLTCTFGANAQLEASIWYFGKNAGLDFRNGSPEVLYDGALDTKEGCATISDANGSLIFYTDGITVWNKNHAVMPNGTGLYGHFSSSQSAIIVPKPKDSDRYYIFTCWQTSGINYSEVDIMANGGLGVVVDKNSPLLPIVNNLPTFVAEKLTAVKHVNGTDIWVIGHGYRNDHFYAWRVTPAGVDANPVTSIIGTDFSSTGASTKDPTGYLKASPDGKKLAICHNSVSVELLDFDNATGTVSNPVLLAENRLFYGTEFSPSGRMLYVSEERGNVYQYDLNAADIRTSEINISGNERNSGALQLGIDGKIYCTNYGENNLSVIHDPDVLGIGCQYEYNAIDLGDRLGYFGLPPFIQSYFYSGRIFSGNVCLGQPTEFKLGDVESIVSVLWDFGDGHISSDEMPIHTYSTTGQFMVTVTVNTTNGTNILTKDIIINDMPVANRPTDIVYCDGGDFLNDDIIISIKDNEILNGQDPSVFKVRYYGNELDALDDENPLPHKFNSNGQNATIYVRVYNDQNNECYAITNFNVMVKPPPEIPLKDYYVICPDSPELILDAGIFESYVWEDQNGNVVGNSQTLNVTELGNYTLTVTDNQYGTTCANSIDFEVLSSGAPESFSVSTNGLSDEIILTIDVIGAGTFEYSIDGLDYQTSNQFKVLPGKYMVYVKDPLGCRTLSKEVMAIGYQKFFTPNGDGANETWNIIGGEMYPESQLYIYDRYGKLLGQFSPLSSGWDGNFLGKPMPSSDYWFKYVYDNDKTYTGHFSLRR